MTSLNYQKIVFCNEHAEIIDADLPGMLDDQLLVKTRCSLISPGTERAALTRLWDDAEFRENPGYALAGDVIAVGRDVEGFSVGDRTISLVNHASLSLVPAEPWVTLKIPDSVSYEDATFLPLASVALHAIRRAQITFGEVFVIIGAGIIGQIAIQLAKKSGAGKVVVLEMQEDRLDLARRYGADVTINPTEVDQVDAVFNAAGGKGASVILEATGNPQVIPTAFKMAGDGGRIVCVGALEEPVSISFHGEFIRRELTLIAAFQPYCPTTENLYWKWTQGANRKLLLDMIASGELDVHEMLTHRFQAKKAPQVYERIKQGDTAMLGVLLEWNQDN
jgi:2-desacetyl-2-hydroxyethyl bacteriochlorophyllide A dehydrogenase